MTKRRYRVTVHAGFDEDGVWIIYARVWYGYDLAPPRHSPIRTRARAALDKAVQREKLRGFNLYGARRAHLHLDAFEDRLDFSLEELVPSFHDDKPSSLE